jgi:RNA polymerase sigma-70 factor (ECF subfamily)
MVPSEPANDELDGWVAETAARAFGYAMTLVRRREVAEDLVQDCYGRLIAGSTKYNLPRDGTPLLFRSITNACINWSRCQSREASFDQPGNLSSRNSHSLMDRKARSPEQEVLQKELEEAVDWAMGELPIDQRAAVELRSLGHSFDEVAEMLETSNGNARVLVHRARAALQQKLKSYLEESST